MLKKFISKPQLRALHYLSKMSKQEGDYYPNLLTSLEEKVGRVPGLSMAGANKDPLVHLHYFKSKMSPETKGGSDWYIIEREDSLAFGFVCLNGDTQNAELGYISIPELLGNEVELDLYFEPTLLSQVKRSLGL